MPVASDDCACTPIIDPNASRVLALATANATHMARIFLVLCFIKLHLFLVYDKYIRNTQQHNDRVKQNEQT
jgi:hypothetical protein